MAPRVALFRLLLCAGSCFAVDARSADLFSTGLHRCLAPQHTAVSSPPPQVVYGDTDSVMVNFRVGTVAEAMRLGAKKPAPDPHRLPEQRGVDARWGFSPALCDRDARRAQ